METELTRRLDLTGNGSLEVASCASTSPMTAQPSALAIAIRIAKREGATLRVLAEATGLSRQTIANICAADPSSVKRRTRAG